jgi:hypothetical protein
MFDDHATPRSPFVVAYSPRSRHDSLTDFFLSSTLRLQFPIFAMWVRNSTSIIAHKSLKPSSRG